MTPCTHTPTSYKLTKSICIQKSFESSSVMYWLQVYTKSTQKEILMTMYGYTYVHIHSLVLRLLPAFQCHTLKCITLKGQNTKLHWRKCNIQKQLGWAKFLSSKSSSCTVLSFITLSCGSGHPGPALLCWLSLSIDLVNMVQLNATLFEQPSLSYLQTNQISKSATSTNNYISHC